jgi:hypothetical protein
MSEVVQTPSQLQVWKRYSLRSRRGHHLWVLRLSSLYKLVERLNNLFTIFTLKLHCRYTTWIRAQFSRSLPSLGLLFQKGGGNYVGYSHMDGRQNFVTWIPTPGDCRSCGMSPQIIQTMIYVFPRVTKPLPFNKVYDITDRIIMKLWLENVHEVNLSL